MNTKYRVSSQMVIIVFLINNLENRKRTHGIHKFLSFENISRGSGLVWISASKAIKVTGALIVSGCFWFEPKTTLGSRKVLRGQSVLCRKALPCEVSILEWKILKRIPVICFRSSLDKSKEQSMYCCRGWY